ncbi:MAG: dihydropteroate synthase [Lentisphaeria bacterium]|nr:dihydropteroate synthase [Lentisphaeria bacterium]
MSNFSDMSDFLHASGRALVMGIVNCTPDSFSGGNSKQQSIDLALRLLDEGADILDLGGESTRPGAEEVPLETEIERLLGVLQTVKKLRPASIISIDTRKSKCAGICLDNGADIINDVSGLVYSPDMAEVVRYFNAKLVIMHSLDGGKSNTQHQYSDVVREVYDFLQKQFEYAVKCGVAAENIIVDPGIGFSKSAAENFELLKNIDIFREIAPVLAGHSRKRFIRETLNINEPADSDGATALISVLAAQKGASIVRVHDVKTTVDYLKIAEKMRKN